ncbi:MAG: manganese efflux pump [Clostridiales bacterium]|nr:manganese efflux pump [Clostridiales bacterium]
MTTLSLLELFLIAIGVSMDAFAVAVCKGLSLKKNNIKNALIVALYFGIFQAGMPLIGYLLGVQFQDSIGFIDHWIAFILLGAIGLSMIKEAKDACERTDDSLCFKTMSVLAIATSIDALAVGVTFAFLKANIISSVLFIGIITFSFSFLGVKIGNVFGFKYKSKAEMLGGIILILMAFKILLDHLGIISF